MYQNLSLDAIGYTIELTSQLKWRHIEMKIVVGSMNPVKIKLVKTGFLSLFPLEALEVVGCNANSNISTQPMNSVETCLGARNRARHSKVLVPDAEYYVGVEGGLENIDGSMQEYTWIYVYSRDGHESKSCSTTFTIPKKIAELIRAGNEFGTASDIFFNSTNLKQGNGTIGKITDDVLTRETYPLSAVICAFAPFKHPEFYW